VALEDIQLLSHPTASLLIALHILIFHNITSIIMSGAGFVCRLVKVFIAAISVVSAVIVRTLLTIGREVGVVACGGVNMSLTTRTTM
jgi:hypothetical protein